MACGLVALAVSACSSRVRSDPTDPHIFITPRGEALAFASQSGRIRNYFERRGPIAAHLLTRSGTSPRIIVAFPAQDQGIGLWFLPASSSTELWLGDDPSTPSSGELLDPVELPAAAGEKFRGGVRATLHVNARQLSVALALLGSVRSLRDYGAGLCLENAAEFPELRNEHIEALSRYGVVRIERELIGGAHRLELLLKGLAGTRLSVRQSMLPARRGCGANSEQPATLIDLAGEREITLELVALSDETPLTPLPARDLSDRTGDERAQQELAFLSYEEKLLAGSWRFLTYFGRDTLLTLDLLAPVLREPVQLAGLGAVLTRIQLDPSATDPRSGTGARGSVAHEEVIGDYAAWQNRKALAPAAQLREPRYDYSMIDEDFMLAPVLARWLRRSAPARTSVDRLLSRTRKDGASYRDALLANLALVLERARPFAENPAPPAEKRTLLVALRPGQQAGQWRDSASGLAFGRYPFDVNAALVPGALAAAVTLYRYLDDPREAARAAGYLAAWRGVEELFRIDVPLADVRSRVAAYAAANALNDVSHELASDALGAGSEAVYSYYGIALDAAGTPLPVLHSDVSFVMAFSEPSDAYLLRAAVTLGHDFPAGLLSPAGLLVANPALAPAELELLDPRQRLRSGEEPRVRLRDLFTPHDYHGTVVWSWQQALLATGLRRQLERADLARTARAALAELECKLWDVIDQTQRLRSLELWSWHPGVSGAPEWRAFGASSADTDEADAIQLWNGAYLALQRPTSRQNPLCSCQTSGAGTKCGL
jgi:hypothetical protein